MASEYLKWKYRDVKPDEPVVYSRKDRIKNWWHYHKWLVLIAAVLLIILCDLIRLGLGIGVTKPDYQIAYVSAVPLTDDAVSSIETTMSEYGQDINRDGKVTVKLNQYLTAPPDPGADAEEYEAAVRIRLMGDLEAMDSCFFLLDDVETFHRKYAILSDASGHPASEGTSPEYCEWGSCPVLSSLELGSYSTVLADGTEVSGNVQELMHHQFIARRGYEEGYVPESAPYYEEMWSKLTRGL